MTEPSRTTVTSSNRMTEEEIAVFLRTKQNAMLGTLRPDGHVQVTPVWYLHEQGKLFFTLGESRVHLKNIRRTGKATLLMEEDFRPSGGWQAPARGVMLCGRAEVLDDEALALRCEERMAAHYLGEGASDPEFVAAVDAERRCLVELTPERTLSWDFSK